MSPRQDRLSEPDDWDDEDCYPDEPEFDDSEPDTIRCPGCGTEVYDDAVRCPTCGNYLTEDTSPWSGRSVWWIILGLLGVVAGILALAGIAP